MIIGADLAQPRSPSDLRVLANQAQRDGVSADSVPGFGDPSPSDLAALALWANRAADVHVAWERASARYDVTRDMADADASHQAFMRMEQEYSVLGRHVVRILTGRDPKAEAASPTIASEVAA